MVVFQEAAREYRGENPQKRRILRYRVDGQMIVDGERCDFLLGIPENGNVYLIELKGTNLKKAASQILTTMGRIGSRLSPFRQHARIVLSRVQRPAVRPMIVLALERKLVERGGRLKYASQLLAEQI
jgi:hypothetical protein